MSVASYDSTDSGAGCRSHTAVGCCAVVCPVYSGFCSLRSVSAQRVFPYHPHTCTAVLDYTAHTHMRTAVHPTDQHARAPHGFSASHTQPQLDQVASIRPKLCAIQTYPHSHHNAHGEARPRRVVPRDPPHLRHVRGHAPLGRKLGGCRRMSEAFVVAATLLPETLEVGARAGLVIVRAMALRRIAGRSLTGRKTTGPLVA